MSLNTFKKERIVSWLRESNVLSFSSQNDFILKSGIKSRYYFDFSRICTDYDLGRVGKFFYETLYQNELLYGDKVIYGVSYKAIPLAISLTLFQESARDAKSEFLHKEREGRGTYNCRLSYSFKKKDTDIYCGEILESKDVVLIDDVLTTGSSIYEAYNDVISQGGKPVAVIVFLDRMNIINPEDSEVSYLSNSSLKKRNRASSFLKDVIDIPVISVVSMIDVLEYLFVNRKFTECCKFIEEEIEYRSFRHA